MKKLHLFKTVLLLCALIVGSSSVWADKITNYTNIVSGKRYYIGATTGGNDYYLSVDGSSTSTSIAGTAVTSITNATPFTFSGSGTSWTIQFASGNYLSLKNSKDNGKVQVVESASTFTASNQSGNKIRLTIGNYSVQKNNSGTQFGSYGNTQTDIWLEEATSVVVPVFSPAAGPVEKGTTVELTTSTDGATIYYTQGENPEDPTSSSTQYIGAITINEATTIKAVAIKGEDKSPVATAEYTIKKVEAPTFSIASGTAVIAGTTVELETETGGAEIHYTTDGSEPTSESATYSSAITIDANMTIKAIAIKNNWDDSEVVSASYTVITPISGLAIDFEVANLTQYTDWEFTNAALGTNGDNQNINARNGTHYGTTGGKATASIQTKAKVAKPVNFTCYVSKQTTNTTSSTWYVQVSSDGSDWDNVVTQSATSMNAGTWVEFTADLSSYSNVYVRLYYSGSTAVRNVDDIVLTAAVPVTISTSGWTSLASAYDLDFSSAEEQESVPVVAYAISNIKKTSVTLTPHDAAPAGVGMILKGKPGSTYSIPVTTSVVGFANELSAAVNATAVEASSVYAVSDGKLKLFIGTEVPAGKAYLLASKVHAEAHGLTLDFDEDGETTGIAEISSKKGLLDGDFYDLSGRKVAQPTKGLYIMNGKKVIIK